MKFSVQLKVKIWHSPAIFTAPFMGPPTRPFCLDTQAVCALADSEGGAPFIYTGLPQTSSCKAAFLLGVVALGKQPQTLYKWVWLCSNETLQNQVVGRTWRTGPRVSTSDIDRVVTLKAVP